MPDMSITGIASGIDWDSMVAKLLEKAQKPALVMLTKRDNLEMKRDLFEEFRVSLQALQSSLSPLKLAATFKARDVEISRLDSNISYKGVLSATANSDAEISVHDLEVLKLAKGQVNRSNAFSSPTAAFGSSLLGSDSTYFYVNAGGHKVRIDVNSTDSLDSLAKQINTKLKTQVPPVDVTAAVVDNKLVLKSDNVGLGKTTHTATITRSTNSYDSVLFSTNPGNTDSSIEPPTYSLDMVLGGAMVVGGGLGEGSILIKDEDGITYRAGLDFDVVGGNRIRWRNLDTAFPTPGELYRDTYSAYAGDTFSVTATRSSNGDVDVWALPFEMSTRAEIQVTFGGNTYSSTDPNPIFRGSATGAILWLSDNKPADGNDYKVTYIAAGSEHITLEIMRGNQDELSENYADIAKGTATIQQPGSRVWREGLDFEIVQSANGKAVVQWYNGGAGDAPEPASVYDITLQKTDGTTTTLNGVTRNDKDVVRLPGNGTFDSVPHGTHSSIIGHNAIPFDYSTSPVMNAWSFNAELDSSKQNLVITWTAPDPASTSLPTPGIPIKSPAYGKTYTVEYTYNASVFTLSDDGNGALAALGLDQTDEEHYTAAQNAEVILNGEKVTISSNRLSAANNSELIKGLTIDLKGLGHVSLDISQDAEPAVTAIQQLTTVYNDIMQWINTRMTEQAVDDTKKATLDSDDFRMKWGLLKGNSLLRNSKSTLRRLTSQIYSTAFTQRSSRQAVYGTMENNGILNAGSFTIAVRDRVGTITVNPGDTLETIAAKINSPTLGELDNPLFVIAVDSKGQEYSTPLVTATVENNTLVIKAGTDQPVTLGGSNVVLSSLGLNYEYSSLSQIGIKLPSRGTVTTDALAGSLEFDTSAFMAALEKNPDDVSMLVTNFAGQMQTYMDNMIRSSQKEVSGIAITQGAVVQEMNALKAEMDSIDKYLADFEKKLQTKQENLYKQFSAAEVGLSKLMQQASWLANVTSQLQQSAG